MQNKENNPKGKNKSKLSTQSVAFLDILTKRGIIEDKKIDDEKVRKAQKEKKRIMYHNTELLLRNYRDILWMLECFPVSIAEELDTPLQNLDALLNGINSEIEMDNYKLENRIASVQRSRILLDRFHEALTVLKQKPNNGQRMYDIIYQTYIIPERLSHNDLLYRLDISTRHYYRLRKQGINILSLRLWAAPFGELDLWLDVLTLLEAMEEQKEE